VLRTTHRRVVSGVFVRRGLPSTRGELLRLSEPVSTHRGSAPTSLFLAVLGRR
jgi:hypothetical protein